MCPLDYESLCEGISKNTRLKYLSISVRGRGRDGRKQKELVCSNQIKNRRELMCHVRAWLNCWKQMHSHRVLRNCATRLFSLPSVFFYHSPSTQSIERRHSCQPIDQQVMKNIQLHLPNNHSLKELQVVRKYFAILGTTPHNVSRLYFYL